MSMFRKRLELGSDIWRRFIQFIQLKMKSDNTDLAYEKVLRRYLFLTVKQELSEADADELESILSQTCQDEKLMLLTQLIDQHVVLVDDALDAEALIAIETGRVNSLERILGTSFNAQKPDFAVRKPVDQAHLRENHYRRFLSRYLLPVSVTVAGFALSVLCVREISTISQYLRSTVEFSWFEQLTSRTRSKHDLATSSSEADQDPKKEQKSFCNQFETGWIDPDLDGNPTAYGKIFRNAEYTTSHAFLPPGSKILMVSEASKKSVEVKVNDRSEEKAFVSYTAAHDLGILDRGVASVTITHVEISKDEVDELNDEQRQQLERFKQDCPSLISSHSISQ
jgi:hypothetical protein